MTKRCHRYRFDERSEDERVLGLALASVYIRALEDAKRFLSSRVLREAAISARDSVAGLRSVDAGYYAAEIERGLEDLVRAKSSLFAKYGGRRYDLSGPIWWALDSLTEAVLSGNAEWAGLDEEGGGSEKGS